MGDEREGLQGWETRDAGSGLSYIERGTGANTERFLAVPLLYDEAVKVEDLIARVGQLTQDHAAANKLLTEAAQVIERLEGRITELEAALETICDIGETRDVEVARAVLSTSKEETP